MAKEQDNAARISVLCRMLFKPKAQAVMRPPRLGSVRFLDDSTTGNVPGPSEWPLEPIAIVDGVPFLIVRGYMLLGRPESAHEYFPDCEANGEWSDVRYHVVTMKQKRDALSKLMKSPKWHSALSEWARVFLSEQIQDTVLHVDGVYLYTGEVYQSGAQVTYKLLEFLSDGSVIGETLPDPSTPVTTRFACGQPGVSEGTYRLSGYHLAFVLKSEIGNLVYRGDISTDYIYLDLTGSTHPYSWAEAFHYVGARPGIPSPPCK